MSHKFPFTKGGGRFRDLTSLETSSRDYREKDLPPTTPPHHLFYNPLIRFCFLGDTAGTSALTIKHKNCFQNQPDLQREDDYGKNQQ